MAKGSGRNKRKNAGSFSCWSATDHAIRKAKQERKKQRKQSSPARQEEKESHTPPSKLLSHDTKEQQEEKKLKLNLTKVKRHVEELRYRLKQWDDVEEEEKAAAEAAKQAEEARLKAEEEATGKKRKKRGRLGPETWKLRGAARPAWEVYDFDVRYVDPHVQAHEKAKAKAARCRNLLALCKGQFGRATDDVPPVTRTFLSLLVQLGMLAMEAKKVKLARKAFVECMALEYVDQESGEPVTPARYQLMRLYMEANRPDSARSLYESLPDDNSCWIRFSAALVEYVSWRVLEEKGSTRETAEAALIQAIQSNVFCAYYLAFLPEFADSVEYGDEIQNAWTTGGLLEALEYCHSEQVTAWVETEGALDWLRAFVLGALHDGNTQGDLSVDDLDWNTKLQAIEKEYKSDRASEGQHQGEDENELVDFPMYAGMFHTTMEMIKESGKLDEEVSCATGDNDDGMADQITISAQRHLRGS